MASSSDTDGVRRKTVCSSDCDSATTIVANHPILRLAKVYAGRRAVGMGVFGIIQTTPNSPVVHPPFTVWNASR
jgi:hypothetical protein